LPMGGPDVVGFAIAASHAPAYPTTGPAGRLIVGLAGREDPTGCRAFG
jgi:hypothetical protein